MVTQVTSKIALILFVFSLHSAKLDSFINRKDVFSLSYKAIDKQFQKIYNYKWNDDNKTSLRSYRVINSYLTYKVFESVINFEKGTLNDIELYYYSRGENGIINDKTYVSIIEGLKKNIENFLQKKNPKSKKQRDGLETYTWITKEKQYVLIAKKSYVSPRVWDYQYIKLNIFKSGTTQRTKQSFFNIKDNLVKNSNGDVYLKNMPMVDQGNKGYCVCANMARVLQYFGRQGDQYLLADLMDTGSNGTSITIMEKALKNLTYKKNMRLQKISISEFPLFGQKQKVLQKFVKQYNRFARRKVEFPIDSYGYKKLIGNIRKDENAFISSRLKLVGGNFKSFIRSIETTIKKATPLSWTVILGLIKEKEIPQAFGGHMRMIIGYNQKLKELIYTDSWGKSHDFKRLSYEKAYAMTTGLYIVSL